MNDAEDRHRLKKSGEKIRKYRRQKNMNQSEFGELIGLSKSSVSMIEAGKVSPSISNYQKMSEVLAVPALELMCLKSSVASDPAALTAAFESDLLHALQKRKALDSKAAAVEGLVQALKNIVSDH